MRRYRYKSRVVVCLLTAITFLLTGFPLRAATAKAGHGYERWGFYVTYDSTSRSSLLSHLAQLDDVCPGYFTMNSNGAIEGNADHKLDARLTAAGKHVYPVVKNGATYAQLTPTLADPARRAAAVAAIANLASRRDYDGITLDFEGVDSNDRANLTQFIGDLAAALHARGKQLVVALPAKTGPLPVGWAGAFDYNAIGTIADRAILMAYSLHSAQSSQPGPIAPLPWVQAVADYALTAIPRDRLVLGIGVWGYDWNLTHPGPPAAYLFQQTASLVQSAGGQLSHDDVNASAEYSYMSNGDVHQIWYEDAASLQQQLAVATRDNLTGVAFWRLGEEPPELWNDVTVMGATDYRIPGGWYFGETAGGTGLGFRVVDDGTRFWSEFQRYGGVATLGYPISRPFTGPGGFTYQAFQRGVLQWRPELGTAYLSNTFEQLSAAGQDTSLSGRGIPQPIADDGSAGDWAKARQTRLSWLTNPAIEAAFYANPNPRAIPHWSVDNSIQLYGLPTSRPVKAGPFVVQRFQRISLQLWVEDVPGMPPKGSVVGILGGEMLKEAGVIPADATVPEGAFGQ